MTSDTKTAYLLNPKEEAKGPRRGAGSGLSRVELWSSYNHRGLLYERLFRHPLRAVIALSN